ncbi:MAG: NAD-dependent epimerase/dehydratase family protein [Pseudomonadota bacterium]
MRVLVTGGNGFLGRHVCRGLREDGHEVRAMCQPGTLTDGMEGLGDVVAADLLDPEDLVDALEGCEAVVHLAALVAEWGRYPWYHRVNVLGTRSLADAAAASGAQRFVFVSSLAVHGVGDFDGADEDAPRDPAGNPYARSKIAAEDLLMEHDRDRTLDVVIVRPGMVPFGEGDLRAFPPLAAAISTGRMPVSGDPRRLTCTIYAPNLAEGIRLCLTHADAPGRVFTITDEVRLSWDDYLRGIALHLGVELTYRAIPQWLARGAAACAETLWIPFGPRHRPPLTRYLARLMTRDLHFSSSRAREILGYRPLVPFEEGLARTVEWWKST